MNTLLTLLPNFAIIAVGAWIGPRLAETSWRQIDWLCFYFLYPALLFGAASRRPIALDSFLLIGALACAIVTAGMALAYCVRALAVTDTPADQAGISQNAWRFNTALGFVAIGALPPEAMSILAIIVGLAIPMANLYAVLALTNGQSHSRLSQLTQVARNPFLLASLSGVIVGLIGKPVPILVAGFIDRLADAAIPIVLLSLGAALRQSRLWPIDRYAMAITSIKLLALPALVWLVILSSGANGLVAATFLIFAALPTASAAHILAAHYGADRSRVAAVVMQSTIIGLITLPLWTALASLIAAN